MSSVDSRSKSVDKSDTPPFVGHDPEDKGSSAVLECSEFCAHACLGHETLASWTRTVVDCERPDRAVKQEPSNGCSSSSSAHRTCVCVLFNGKERTTAAAAAAAMGTEHSEEGRQNTERTSPRSTSKVVVGDMAFVNSIRNYSEKRLIGYTREQLFEVVAAVENYHLFVPACRKSDVVQKSKDRVKARLEIGIPPLLESYTSNVRLDKPRLITASCIEGTLFKHLETRWKFNLPPQPHPPEEVCLLDFYVSFEFKSLLYARLASPIFDEMVRLNVSAFLKRAEKLYGPPNKLQGFISEQH